MKTQSSNIPKRYDFISQLIGTSQAIKDLKGPHIVTPASKTSAKNKNKIKIINNI